MKWMVGVGVALAIGGCATTAPARAPDVALTTNHELARGCRFLGQHNDQVGTMPAFMATSTLRSRAMGEAVAKGGNLVVSAGAQIGPVNPVLRYPAVTMTSDIYACPTPPPPSSSTSPE